MSDNKESELIIKTINEAMGSHLEYFNIWLMEVTEDDGDQFSAIVSFEPKAVKDKEYVVVGGRCVLEFCVDDGEAFIAGEDNQVDISLASIYAQLYWNEATTDA
jgi:hypothetical protein